MAMARYHDDPTGGYFFVEPDTEAMEQLHIFFCGFYRPLIWCDKSVGSGRAPSALPLKGLE